MTHVHAEQRGTSGTLLWTDTFQRRGHDGWIGQQNIRNHYRSLTLTKWFVYLNESLTISRLFIYSLSHHKRDEFTVNSDK